MLPRRFKVDELGGPVIRVSGSEAYHALRVLRLAVGGEVVLFDGRGHEIAGRIRSVFDRAFEVEVIYRRDCNPRRCPFLHIAVAPPKGSRADWLVEKCAELGVCELWLLRSERGVVMPGEGKLARWRRKSVEAAKQSGGTITMKIQPPQPLADILGAAAEMSVLYGDPVGEKATLHQVLEDLAARRACPANVLIVIGPEGGFTGAERAEIEEAGGRGVRLSSTVLRVETAAVAAASVWASRLVESVPPVAEV